MLQRSISAPFEADTANVMDANNFSAMLFPQRETTNGHEYTLIIFADVLLCISILASIRVH